MTETKLRFTVDGEEAALPQQAITIFLLRESESPLLAINRQGLLIHCHFFWPGEIEFDIDPREVTSEDRFSELVAFMKSVSDAVGKEFIMTHETGDCDQEEVLLRCLPLDYSGL